MVIIKIEETASGDVKFTFSNLDTSTNAEREALLLMREGLRFNPVAETTQQSEDEDE